MANQTITNEGYYRGSQTFLGNGSATTFTLLTTNFDPLPKEEGEFNIYINNVIQLASTYSYVAATGVVTFTTAPALGATVSVELADWDRELGSYQFIKLNDIVNNFIISYVGEEKIITKASRTDIAFHAQRAVQELNYDTLKSEKSQEIEVPTTLTMKLPHDYVNYTKVCWVDDSGVEKIMYPIKQTGNPSALLQDSDYNYIFDSDGKLTLAENSETWKRYKEDALTGSLNNDDNKDAELERANSGRRYGIEPYNAQANGGYFISNDRGRIYFTSNVSDKIVTLHYVSDGINTDDMKVHKFAEEAMYKYIAHAILSTRINTPEYLVRRFKKERFAEIRKAKLRLFNLKSEELAQAMRGKSKWIKH
tara:strand:+ start:355 stop:1449 length:1095 start_codon:yes stop_codon:yes gene_type:complete